MVRFDKITLANPEHLEARPESVTVSEEYSPQVLAAIRLLAEQPGVAVGRMVLIGHSQGARDYQTTVGDDLARWRSLLDTLLRPRSASTPTSTTCSRGTGPSTPADYDRPQHLHAEIITAITEWIRAPD